MNTEHAEKLGSIRSANVMQLADEAYRPYCTLRRVSVFRMRVLLASCVILAIGAGVTALTLNHRSRNRVSVATIPGTDLGAARAMFHTRLIHPGPAGPIDEGAPPPGMHRTIYQSAGLGLKAWLGNDPADGRKHPAVVFLHGGFALRGDDWGTKAGHYASDGFIVMAPMLRGENGNPGRIELWCGEVDDVVAAGRYLRALSYVDPGEIYLAGADVGGTLAMLVAEVDSPYRSVVAMSGTADRFSWAKNPQSLPPCPFDLGDRNELRIRSPLDFVASLRCPLRVYYGSVDPVCRSDAKKLEAEARRCGKPVTVEELPGNHETTEVPGIADSVLRFDHTIPP